MANKANIGSVFLGDLQRIRNLSAPSTPPSSPPPSASKPNPFSPPLPSDGLKSPLSLMDTFAVPPTVPPPTIDPDIALELRVRWLEAIILGVKDSSSAWAKEKGKGREDPKQTLVRLAEDAQRTLDGVVESNDGLKRFIEHYDQYAHLLTPAFALSGALPEPPTYDDMSSEELDAFLTEMEPDIRAADRDMREIEVLVQKGVTKAGKLADFEELTPRLDTLLKAQMEDLELAATLEKRIALLMDRHATHVDALSELFVEWDDVITEAEGKVTRLERRHEERQRLGYE